MKTIRKTKPEDAFERITTALLARDSRHSGNDYICPAHDDKKPSLGVTRKNGKLLVNCAAGCRTVEVLAALDMTMADLRNGSGPSHETESRPPQPLPPEADINRWHRALLKNEKLLSYFGSINQETLKRYRIGWDATARFQGMEPSRKPGAYVIPYY